MGVRRSPREIVFFFFINYCPFSCVCAYGCRAVTTTGLFFGIGSYVYLFKVSHVEHAAATTISCRVYSGLLYSATVAASVVGGRRDGKTMTTRLIMVINYFHSVFVPMFSPWTVAKHLSVFFSSSAVQRPLGGTETTTTAVEERESEKGRNPNVIWTSSAVVNICWRYLHTAIIFCRVVVFLKT